jgi:hypothetical protein
MKTCRLFIISICLAVFVLPGRSGPAVVADVALVNGRLWTGAGAAPPAAALAISGDRILRVGANAEIKQLTSARTQIIDLGGRRAAPGFNDAHIHFLSGALGLTEVDLTDAKSVAEMQRRITDYARQHPAVEWITGRGWEYTPFPGGLPQREQLDAVVSDRPVFLRAYDGHSGWANSKALQLAGVTRATKFDGFGEIVRDAQGEPTGALKEGAQRLVARLLPEPTRERKLEALRAGLKLAAKLGVTSIQNASGNPAEFALYEELLKNGELTLRVRMAFSVGQQTTRAEIERWTALKQRYDNHPLLRCNAVKFALDGVIESHTAALLAPYSDQPQTSGKLSWPLDAYREKVLLFDKLGFQIFTHAIGDRAVRTALDAYEYARRINRRQDARHRIEHIETIAPADLPRFARLGVLASMEPIHADPGTAEIWSQAVGPERVKRAFAWNELQQNGARLVFSSDWPAAISVDPLRGLHSAVNRRTIDGQPPPGWVPQQRITLAAALRAYTQAGAYASFEERSKGRLAADQLADVIVFAQDLFAGEPLNIHAARVALTVFDGKVLYRDNAQFP